MHLSLVALVVDDYSEPYGKVVVWRDIAGNKWDLLGPAASD